MVIAAPNPLCESDETMGIVCDGCAHVWMDPVHLEAQKEIDGYGWGLFVPPLATAPSGDEPS